jgi:hypothetical protein
VAFGIIAEINLILPAIALVIQVRVSVVGGAVVSIMPQL